MARRIAALLTLLVIVALALTLIWRVHGHRVRGGTFEQEPAALDVRLEPVPAANIARLVL